MQHRAATLGAALAASHTAKHPPAVQSSNHTPQALSKGGEGLRWHRSLRMGVDGSLLCYRQLLGAAGMSFLTGMVQTMKQYSALKRSHPTTFWKRQTGGNSRRTSGCLGLRREEEADGARGSWRAVKALRRTPEGGQVSPCLCPNPQEVQP